MKSLINLILSFFILVSCVETNAKNDKNNVVIQTEETKQKFQNSTVSLKSKAPDYNREGVTLELSIPAGDSLRRLGVCWDHNLVDIIVRNGSDSVVNFYDDGNYYGHFNLTFEIETHDSTYHVKRTKDAWLKSYPYCLSINPGQSLVFHADLKDSSCTKYGKKRKVLRGNWKCWTGLPDKPYNYAKMRVMYSLPEKYHVVPDWSSWGVTKTDSLPPPKPVYAFSEDLVSDWVEIKVLD